MESKLRKRFRKEGSLVVIKNNGLGGKVYELSHNVKGK